MEKPVQGRTLILSLQVCPVLAISGTFISTWPTVTRNLGHGWQGRNLKSGRMAASNSDPQLVREVSARTTQPEHLGPGGAKGQGWPPLGCSKYPSSYSQWIFIGLKVRDEFRPAVMDAQRSKGSMEGADLQEGAGCPRFSFPGRPLLGFKVVGETMTPCWALDSSWSQEA